MWVVVVCGTGFVWVVVVVGAVRRMEGEGAGRLSTASGGGGGMTSCFGHKMHAEIVVDLAAQHEANRNFQYEP